MTDLLTFIEATKGTSLKIEVTSKDLLEFADALVERAAAKARAEIERQSDVEYILTSCYNIHFIFSCLRISLNARNKG